MSGRVRKLACSTVECLASSNMQLTGPSKTRAITVGEMHTYLTWMDSNIREQIVEMQDIRVQLSATEFGTCRVAAPTALLHVLSHYETEKHNSLSKFYQEFQVLATTAGHIVQSDESKFPARKADPKSLPTTIKRLLEAPDVNKAEQDAIFSRIRRNKASEQDKYTFYRVQYKAGRGVDILDEDFVLSNGAQPICIKTQQLIHVLFPHLDMQGDIQTEDKRINMRVPLIVGVVKALGFASPFDTNHIITDLMNVWREGVRHTKMFQDARYHNNRSLFSTHVAKTLVDSLTPQQVVKSINMVLNAIGLSLQRLSKVNASCLDYEMKKSPVKRMIELVKLRVRKEAYAFTAQPQHAHDALERCSLPVYGHLIFDV